MCVSRDCVCTGVPVIVCVFVLCACSVGLESLSGAEQ